MSLNLDDRINKVDIPEITGIWGTELSGIYEQFALKLKSDKIAYTVVNWMVTRSLSTQGLAPGEGNVLDFGCYRGESTMLLYNRTAGARIVGVDNSLTEMNLAKSRNPHPDKIDFRHVGKIKPIPTPYGKYNVASMTFVHPTISTLTELEATIRKISDSLTEGGSLVMLGLNPASLDPRYQFNYYDHSLPDNQGYEDGKPFNNVLRLSPNEEIEFQDFCWTQNKLGMVLAEHGFSTVNIMDLSQDLGNEVGEMLRATIDKSSGGEQWQDEWTAPLYQVIYAEKRTTDKSILY